MTDEPRAHSNLYAFYLTHAGVYGKMTKDQRRDFKFIAAFEAALLALAISWAILGERWIVALAVPITTIYLHLLIESAGRRWHLHTRDLLNAQLDENAKDT